RLTILQDEPDASHRVDQPSAALDVNLLAQTRHLHVDHIVDWCRPSRLFPDLSREHFARDEVTLMAEQILEELELATGEVERPVTANRPPRDDIELQVRDFQAKDVRWASPPEQGSNTSQELRHGERLDKVIVGAEIEPQHPIVNAVAGGENQNRCFNP